MQPKTMPLSETNEQEISKVLCKMKNKKSAGYDGISNEILKCCSPIIESHLAKSVNKCITEVFSQMFESIEGHSFVQKR